MKRIISLFILLPFAIIAVRAAAVISSDVMDNTLLKLDRELSIRETYKDNRIANIIKIKNELEASSDTVSKCIDLTMQLANVFTAFDNDSTLYYIKKGYVLSESVKNDSMKTTFLLKYITYLPLAGNAVEATEIFEKIDTAGMTGSLKTDYLTAAAQMSSYLISAFENQREQVEYWSAKRKLFQKELLALLPKGSALRLLNEAEYLYSINDFEKAEKLFESVKDMEPDSSNLFARATHSLAKIAQRRGDYKATVYYLALSSMADIKSATLEVTSLQMLGMLLFENGDLERSYQYLSAALENAVECNASMRVLETSSTLPIIEKAHTSQARKSMQRLTLAFIIVALLLIMVVALLFYLRLQINRKTLLQGHLEGANRIKEIYLSQFINLCSIYMSKLTSFNKMVSRKITSGKIEDLAKITKSGKFVEEQSREFYDIFDDAFLHIYPSFVEAVNSLLLPDKQIVLQEGEKLNTDLRILAFIRLGLEDSNRVAQMLNYSVNTIYAYRNRIRNRAINRDTFEEDIMKISSI